MTTVNQVNKALKAAGFKDAELVKSKYKGYFIFYFAGSDTDSFSEAGIYGISRLSDMTVEDWVNEFKERYQKAHN